MTNISKDKLEEAIVLSLWLSSEQVEKDIKLLVIKVMIIASGDNEIDKDQIDKVIKYVKRFRSKHMKNVMNNVINPLTNYSNDKKVKKMTNISKDKLKTICKAVLDNTLSIAANNLIFEAAIAFNSAGSIPESERNKTKELETFMKAINGQIQQAKEQAMIYIDELIVEKRADNAKSKSNIEKYMNFVVESKLYTLEEAERCIDNLYYRMKKEIEGEAAYYRDITQRNSWSNPNKSVKTIGINGRLIYVEDFLNKSQTEF